MCQLNWQGHQLRCFVASEAKHEALIACATRIHSHRDVWRLTVERGKDTTSFRIKAKLCSCVANVSDCISRDFCVIDTSFRSDFTGDHNQAGRNQGLASDAR